MIYGYLEDKRDKPSACSCPRCLRAQFGECNVSLAPGPARSRMCYLMKRARARRSLHECPGSLRLRGLHSGGRWTLSSPHPPPPSLISHLLCHRVNCWFCYHALYFSTPVFSLTSLDCVPGWNRQALKMSRDSRLYGRLCDGYRATECEATTSGIAWSPVRPHRIPPNIVDWAN